MSTISGKTVTQTVTVDDNALGLGNFQEPLFGPTGYSTLGVSNTVGTLPITISGVALTSDVIDLTAIGSDGHVTKDDTANHRVTITGSLDSVTLQLDASDGATFTAVSDGSGG